MNVAQRVLPSQFNIQCPETRSSGLLQRHSSISRVDIIIDARFCNYMNRSPRNDISLSVSIPSATHPILYVGLLSCKRITTTPCFGLTRLMPGTAAYPYPSEWLIPASDIAIEELLHHLQTQKAQPGVMSGSYGNVDTQIQMPNYKSDKRQRNEKNKK